MKNFPEIFLANFGFCDPIDNTRHDLLSHYEFQDEDQNIDY